MPSKLQMYEQMADHTAKQMGRFVRRDILGMSCVMYGTAAVYLLFADCRTKCLLGTRAVWPLYFPTC